MISQITPAGLRPASRAKSTEPSVCPARTKTPPLRARKGKMCPGITRSCGLASSAIASRMVLALSAAEMPVVIPLAESTDTVNAVPKGEVFSDTIIVNPRCRTRSSVRGRQIKPRPYVAMKLMASGVTFSAAMQRSPSFSRSLSSIKMTIRPRRISAIASSIVASGMGVYFTTLSWAVN